MRRAAAIGLLAVLFAALPSAASRTLVIQRFESTIALSRDGSIDVLETIEPRFTGSWNGIYRTIPVEYRTPQGLNYSLRLSIESITDEDGTPLKWESSRERHYRKLKIWVPGATDTTRVVRIRYRVANALRFFDDHDELYWNITGDEWDVPIESATASIHLPSGVSGLRATAFRGEYGSTERNTVEIHDTDVDIATGRLGFHEGLTAAVGWDPGIVHRPTPLERVGETLYSNWPLGLPIVVLGAMFVVWRKRGRDPRIGTVATQYEPPAGMTPAELGTLVDGTPDMRDITATIVDLAVRGYLHIEEKDTPRLLGLWSNRDYVFTLKTPREEWQLKPHERALLDAMFEDEQQTIALSALKNKFYTHLPKLRDGLYDYLVTSGCYAARPDKVRGDYMVYGFILAVLVGFLGSKLLDWLGMADTSAIISGVSSGGIVALFGLIMPARTIRGTHEVERILGFREFLSRVESDRMNRVIKTPEMFEKYLPYAMALGVEHNWARAFEDIYRDPPRWYSGAAGFHTFNATSFSSDMSRMSAAAGSVMASSPRGSGGSGFSGGSSGGGFGGGGGGGF